MPLDPDHDTGRVRKQPLGVSECFGPDLPWREHRRRADLLLGGAVRPLPDSGLLGRRVVRGDAAVEACLSEQYARLSASAEPLLLARQGVDLDAGSVVRGQGLVLVPDVGQPPRKHDDVVKAEEWAAIHGCLARVSEYHSILRAWSDSRKLAPDKRLTQLSRTIEHAVRRLESVWTEHEQLGKAMSVDTMLRSVIISAGNLFLFARCQCVLEQLKLWLQVAADKASRDAANKAKKAFGAG